MLCLIAKHLLSDSYGLFDRFLEIGVFLLIAYEVGVGIVRHRRTTKRKNELDRKVATLSRFMGEGQKIQREVPQQYDPVPIEEWTNAVNTWSRDTHGFLEKCSPRAAASFVLIAETGVLANPLIVHT